MSTVKPTPTQEENDRAALGEHILEHEPDGSPEVESSAPDIHGRVKTKTQEAKKPGSGYETRTVQPRPHASKSE